MRSIGSVKIFANYRKILILSGYIVLSFYIAYSIFQQVNISNESSTELIVNAQNGLRSPFASTLQPKQFQPSQYAIFGNSRSSQDYYKPKSWQITGIIIKSSGERVVIIRSGKLEAEYKVGDSIEGGSIIREIEKNHIEITANKDSQAQLVVLFKPEY